MEGGNKGPGIIPERPCHQINQQIRSSIQKIKPNQRFVNNREMAKMSKVAVFGQLWNG